MLALTAAEALYERDDQGVKDVFRKNHPGGAIGAKTRKISVEADVTCDGLATPPGL
jgi:hypothetical protein